MKLLSAILFLSVICLGSCSPDKKESTNEAAIVTTSQKASEFIRTTSAFAQTIELAHQKKAFQEYAAIQFHLVLSFGGFIPLLLFTYALLPFPFPM